MKWFVKCLKNYATFRGRASRSEYWYFVLWCLVLILAVVAVAYAVWPEQRANAKYVLLGMQGFFLLPLMAVQTRRLHDVGRSGWWVVGLWCLAFAAELTGLAQNLNWPWAEFVADVELPLALLFAICKIVLLYWFLKPSDSRINDYGAPLSHRVE